MRAAAHVEPRIALVQAFLLARLPATPPDPRAVQAARALAAPGSTRSVSAVARALGLSRRHLGRLFRTTVGTTAKTSARTVRFQEATRRRRAGTSWCDAAAASGCSDQAHLTKDCVRLTGVTPSVLDRRVERTPLQAFFNPGGAGRAEVTSYL
jgi:methylphosphotriester-DNA--protein-cysteine methyltransferase